MDAENQMLKISFSSKKDGTEFDVDHLRGWWSWGDGDTLDADAVNPGNTVPDSSSCGYRTIVIGFLYGFIPTFVF